MKKRRQAVARLSALEVDRGQTVPLGEGHCTLFLHQGKCFAVGSTCPHQNAPLHGAIIRDGQIVCRRHGYRFDAATGECLTTGGYGLPVFATEIEGDTVYVAYWEADG